MGHLYHGYVSHNQRVIHHQITIEIVVKSHLIPFNHHLITIK